MTDAQVAVRPLPLADNLSETYWRAAADGRLLIQECRLCGERQFYPRLICTACGAEPSWLEAGGRGRVYTYTVIRQNHATPFNDLVPYVVAMIELEEGPLMMGNLTGLAPEDVHIGQDVQVYFEPVEDGLAVPFWQPAT